MPKLKEFLKKSLDELFERPNRKERGVPLLVTYHPRFYNLSAIIWKYFTFLYAEEKVKRVFTPTSFISFRSGYSLRNHLVRAKVYPLIREKGTFCCGTSWCETCCSTEQCDNFESSVTKKVHKINHSFNCGSKCLIRLFFMQGLWYSLCRFHKRQIPTQVEQLQKLSKECSRLGNT